MPGPQFVHASTHSRKPDPAGRCIDQVLGEAERLPAYCHHVALPLPPELVAGLTLPELRAAHDAMVAGACTPVRVGGRVRSRAIRKDRHTLMTVVASYPLSWNQIGHSAYAQDRLAQWEEATVAWARAHFGRCFASVVRHRDEPYPHLHVFALPLGLEGVDACLLHLGKRTKRETLRQLKADGVPAKEATRAANAAYRQAMRDFQDEYYCMVGELCALTRTGPNRARFTRAEWHTRKHEAELRAERLGRLELREAHADAREEELKTREREQDFDWTPI